LGKTLSNSLSFLFDLCVENIKSKRNEKEEEVGVQEEEEEKIKEEEES
jgi:hypothetical protein